jgi:hypothetical protein
MKLALAAAALAAVAAGCGGASLHLASAAAARRQATAVHSHWPYDALHFPPRLRPRRSWLVTRESDPRLAGLAHRYDFQVVSFHYLAHEQAASIVVQTRRPLRAFAADTSTIERAIDPVWHGGLSYHAFFFEARDSHSIPFIATQHSIVNAHAHSRASNGHADQRSIHFHTDEDDHACPAGPDRGRSDRTHSNRSSCCAPAAPSWTRAARRRAGAARVRPRASSDNSMPAPAAATPRRTPDSEAGDRGRDAPVREARPPRRAHSSSRSSTSRRPTLAPRPAGTSDRPVRMRA